MPRKPIIVEDPEESLALTTAVKLNKDLKVAAAELGPDEGRFLVSQYYTIQENRISARHQGRANTEQDKPYELLAYVGNQYELIEKQISIALDIWSAANPVGTWLRSITGIGPVIAAGLLAHLDITKAPTAGGFMRFAGIDPTAKWEKGQKRPWNADLKVLVVFKIPESFIKMQNNKDDFYGKIMVAYKKKITDASQAGAYAARAAELLATRKYRKETEPYKEMVAGRLCKAHIHAMARRKIAKLFISHVHEVMYWHHYGKSSPVPYPLVHLSTYHPHYINVPNMHLFPGMAESRKESLAEFNKVMRITQPSQMQKVFSDDLDAAVEDISN